MLLWIAIIYTSWLKSSTNANIGYWYGMVSRQISLDNCFLTSVHEAMLDRHFSCPPLDP